jgi:hypothetical protein
MSVYTDDVCFSGVEGRETRASQSSESVTGGQPVEEIEQHELS